MYRIGNIAGPPPAHAGHVIVVPGTGRRFADFIVGADGAAHKDLRDLEIDAPCSECGRPDGTQRCDFLLPEKSFQHCNRRLCKTHAVHDPRKNDTDYCKEHAPEAGLVVARG